MRAGRFDTSGQKVCELAEKISALGGDSVCFAHTLLVSARAWVLLYVNNGGLHQTSPHTACNHAVSLTLQFCTMPAQWRNMSQDP